MKKENNVMNCASVFKPKPWPNGKPLPVIDHERFGKPNYQYPYHNRDGNVELIICRFENANGKKIVLPYTPGVIEGKFSGKFMMPSGESRNPYNLNEILQHAEKTILFVEGEKSAEASNMLFSDLVSTTTSGGSKAPKKTDFSSFKGRNIVIWPDNDSSGADYGIKVAMLAINAGAASVKIVKIEDRFPPKWDLADPLPEGITFQLLVQMIKEAPLFEPESEQPASENGRGKRKKILAADVADEFLNNGILGSASRFGYWRGEFYSFSGGIYTKKSKEYIGLKIIEFLRDKYREKSEPSFVNSVVANISQIAYLHEDASDPCFFDDPTRTLSLFPMKNEAVDIEKLCAGASEGVSVSYNQNLFLLGKTDYPFQPDQKCPYFQAILDRILPDLACQDLLFEVMGEILTRGSRFQKFLLMVGEGANGKSVICLIMRLLLGKMNVSSLGLEEFYPGNFSLAQIEGKLANICSDVSETSRVAEGLIKQIIAGDLINIPRKYLSALQSSRMPFLIFSANQMPTWRDRSSGLYRRALVLMFNVQIPESEQDRRFVDSQFWIDSGELSGIFNRAIAARIRLYKNNGFTIPISSQETLDEHRKESNSARQYLSDYWEYVGTSSRDLRVCKKSLFRQYRNWAADQNTTAMNANNFSREVKRVFPGIEFSTNALYIDPDKFGNCVRDRVWYGLKPLDNLTRDRPVTQIHR